MTGKDKLQARPLAAVLATAIALMLCKNAVKASNSYIVLGLLLALCTLKAALWYKYVTCAKATKEEDLAYLMHSVFNFILLILASKYLRSFTIVQSTVEKAAAILRLPNLLCGWYAYMVPVLFAVITAGKNYHVDLIDPTLCAVASFCVLIPDKLIN